VDAAKATATRNGAGGYVFADFLRVGIPLNLLFWAVSAWAIPRLFPF